MDKKRISIVITPTKEESKHKNSSEGSRSHSTTDSEGDEWPEEEEEEHPSAKEEIVATYKLFIDSRMRRLLPVFIWSAISCVIYTASFSPLFTLGMANKSPPWDSQK
jgi:hypothetical protein